MEDDLDPSGPDSEFRIFDFEDSNSSDHWGKNGFLGVVSSAKDFNSWALALIWTDTECE
jgi:hypothetical protein